MVLPFQYHWMKMKQSVVVSRNLEREREKYEREERKFFKVEK